MTARAIGAAVAAPKPAFSTISATAIFGWSAGAKASYSAWSRLYSGIAWWLYFSFLPSENVCAVPVLPADTYCAPMNALAAVPDWFTPTMARLITSMLACLSGMR
ncbi:hypothetical protein R82526_04134 [Ralstonia mannitolilytica]|nr:hypothetical protein R82526_04134 [Ralstonia mannitolilytica]CAJ0886128.1 hypothetical protein R76727_03811 [Ralstonia mannitolilytica]